MPADLCSVREKRERERERRINNGTAAESGTTVTFRVPAESEREILLTCRKDPKARLRKERNGPPLGTAPDWSDSNMGLSPLSLPARNRTLALLKKIRPRRRDDRRKRLEKSSTSFSHPKKKEKEKI